MLRAYNTRASALWSLVGDHVPFGGYMCRSFFYVFFTRTVIAHAGDPFYHGAGSRAFVPRALEAGEDDE